MKLIYGNLWNQKDADAICITTNGFVKSNGECVMGKGCALEAAKMEPSIKFLLGQNILQYGNIPHVILDRGKAKLISFPVKPINLVSKDLNEVVEHMKVRYKKNSQGFYVVPGWACKASLEIIESSCINVSHLADLYDLKKIILPRPGIGAGALDWSEVKPILEKHLDDRFHVITFKEP